MLLLCSWTISRLEVPAQLIFRDPFSRDVPIGPIDTLDLSEPSPWLVGPRKVLYDLDNIQLL
jgi:hypothetical protein